MNSKFDQIKPTYLCGFLGLKKSFSFLKTVNPDIFISMKEIRTILPLLQGTLLAFGFLFFAHCKDSKDLNSFRNSLRDDIDLFLIPEKFNVVETDLQGSNPQKATYLKSDLVRQLKSYGRTIQNLESNPELEYSEKDDVVTMKVRKTWHSTSYPYDSNIPIIFYGTKWFKTEESSMVIHQQHIVPTLAKIMKVRNPNGVETNPILKILKNPNSSEKPDIIVTIVVDQGGQQYYRAHPETPKHIEAIRKESAYFPNARVGHVDTQTSVGHAAIGTGAYPKLNGIIGNTFFRMVDGKVTRSEVYATGESEVLTEELRTETFADVLDFENGNLSEIISQCYALRASIGMAGHGSYQVKNSSYNGDKDFVYWLSYKEGKWITDSRYYSLPAVSSEFNVFENYIHEYPGGWRNLGKPVKEELGKNWGDLMATPAEVRMEGEMFRKAIQSEIIDTNKHHDGHTDLAFVTFKGTDAAGHGFGWESLEAKEAFAETDRQIGLIFEMLKKYYGDNFILVITADHGCAPLPEISGGSRLTVPVIFREVNSLLNGKPGSLINFMTEGQISLNQELMKENSITEKDIRAKLLSIKVNDKPFFKDVLYKKDLIPETQNE